MVLSAAVVFVSLFGLALSTPLASRSMQVHQSRSSVPSGFTLNGPASSETTVQLRIALKQNNMEGLIETLYDVSTPTSANYGQWLSTEEVSSFVAPSSDTLSAVSQWLEENDITSTPLSPAGDWISISVPVSKANSLLEAEFSTFTQEETGKQLIRTLAYSIPTDLVNHIEFVHPTVNFATIKSKTPVFKKAVSSRDLNSRAAPASCATSITPTCLQEQYGIPTAAGPSASSRIAVSGFIEQFANQADLKSFLTRFRTDISSSTTFTLQTVDGGENPQTRSEAGIEADLDTQYTVGLATGIPVTFISVGEDNTDGVDGFLDIINFLLSESSPPQVLTTSYGFNEDDFTGQESLATSLCNAYAQLGAKGVSIVFSSGDGGVAGSQTSECSTSFLPTFPSTCPFLTSIGATQGAGTETAADFSSGGFSNIFARPSFQSSAVAGYLAKLGSTNAGLFNTSGRAFPDIAFNGVDFNIFFDAEEGTVDGTSCSTPSFASVVALINSQLIAAGKPVLGYLNPFIYSTASSAFTDITSGDNPGCGTNGFPALSGWDPITGFGTPIFSKLLAAAGL